MKEYKNNKRDAIIEWCLAWTLMGLGVLIWKHVLF